MRSTVATIDLDALRWNLSCVRQRAGNAHVLGMVKANAYGHGIVPVSQALVDAGIDMLGVAFLDEAIALRTAGITAPILILTPTESSAVADVLRWNLTTVACSLDQARELSESARKQGVTAEMHVYIDTGMHRDGIQVFDAPSAIEAIGSLPNINLSGICTHFATSDELNHPYFTTQLKSFRGVLDACAAAGRTFAHIHAANSGAIWQAEDAVFTLVRPGLSLYGYASPSDDVLRLRPVMSLTTAVVAVRRIQAGESVSYGQRFISSKATSIATIPVGYGDGYMRSLTGKAEVLIRGKRYPVVGVICMDECMVDVGDDDVAIGEEVVVLGTQKNADGNTESIDATELARWAGTIPYEITTAIASRVHRQYRQ